ncbi:MAG: DUF2490 domain-containing protein [Woeseiaceae bacterium]|jgi:hypothetical protein|nr:DUF2490 domain-containing protein [Woeseiaceae bacterium]
MRTAALLLLILAWLAAPSQAHAQIDEDQLGAWYMYFFDARFDDSQWGVQGDLQYRNWDMLGDLEQLLLRGGLTWRPRSNDALLTLGYANITTGEFGDGDGTVNEDRIYQEAALPQKIGNRIFLRHRFRYEQRWVESQDFRTRFRYAIFMNVPFNRDDLGKGAWYLSLYNEIFINGERDIGDGRTVELFDRNRFYAAIGYSLSDRLRLQTGFMHQKTDNWDKPQFQLSLHQAF